MKSSTSNPAPRRSRNFCAVSLVLLCAALFAGPNAWAAPKPVFTHYMPWFVAKPFSGSWGWHWTMNHFNPDIVDGNGQREIASWYYPEIGPYDSDDDAVLEYQVTLMKLAGIDGVIVDWYGMDNYADYAVNNQRTLALFNWTRKAGLQFALCYEDQTIRAEVAAKFIATNQAVAHAQQTMLYAQSNFFNDPSYARLGGQPVLLNFGPQYFTTSANWSSIFSVLSGSNATPAFFTEDNRLGLWKGAFEWPPMWMAATNAGVLNATQLDEYLTAFEQKARAVPPWPAYISSAFPRFHDIYAQAGVSASYGILDDASGATFQNTLRRAFTNTSSLVQLVTWNDYGEGTIIEPTAQFGLRDLETLQDFRRLYLNAAYAGATNDLSLPERLFHARQKYPGDAIIAAELNRIFTNATTGEAAEAAMKLTGLESGLPVIYDLTVTNGQIQFSVGGYLTASGVQIQATTDPAWADWQTAATLATGAEAPLFSAPINSLGGPTFFKVRRAP